MARDYISDDALDRWYGADYYGPGRDYFDGPPDEDYDPDYDDMDMELAYTWVKPGERGY